MKFLALGALGLALAAGLGVVAFFWLNAPTTELVDASGGELTAGPSDDAVLAAEPERGSAAAEPGPHDEARRMIEEGRLVPAKEELVRLLETSDRDGETCILLSRVTRELDELDQAVDYGLKAVELLPESGEAHHAYAKALAEKMLAGGNRLAALALLPKWKSEVARTIELDPSNVDARLEQITFYLYVPSLVGGDVDRALELCRELEEHDPSKGLLWRALAHLKNEELDVAEELCRRGMKAFPEEGMFASTLGNVLAEAGRYEEADAAFDGARQGPPGEAYYRTLVSQAGMLVEAERDHERAVRLLNEYLAASPDYPLMPPPAVVWLTKGRAYAGMGRTEEARAAFETCLRLQPDLSAAKEALEELD